MRENVFFHAPKLVEKLESIFNKGKKSSIIIHIEYNYGETVLQKGQLNLPEELAKKDFAFAVVIDHGLEVFIEEREKIIPIAMLEPGQHFNMSPELCSVAFPLAEQTITAGARSAFLLPKITNSDRFWRLARRHHLDFDIPHNLFEQWPIFVNLARSSTWRANVLLFPSEWLAGQSLAVLELKQYLQEHQKPNPSFTTEKLNFNKALGQAMREIGFKNAYFTSTLNQLFAITDGFLPGYVFAKSDLFLPFAEIRNAFFHDYGGMKTLPDMIIPGYPSPGRKCFYSFELETLLEQHGKRSKDNSSLDNLKVTQFIYSRVKEYLLSHPVHDPAIMQFLDAQIAFLHSYAEAVKVKPPKKDCLAFLKYSPFGRKGFAAIEWG